MTVNTRAWPKRGAAAEPQPWGRVSSACSTSSSVRPATAPELLQLYDGSSSEGYGCLTSPRAEPLFWAGASAPGGSGEAWNGSGDPRQQAWWLLAAISLLVEKSLGCINCWFALQG